MLDLLEFALELVAPLLDLLVDCRFGSIEPAGGWRFYLPVILSLGLICTLECCAPDSKLLSWPLVLLIAGVAIGFVWDKKCG